MLSRVLLISLCLLASLPAATIEEEPSPYPVPEFHYELDFVMNLVFAFALPPLDSEEEFNSVFLVLAPQYQRWLDQLAGRSTPPTQGNIITIGDNIIPTPPPVLPDPIVGVGDLTAVPEPSSALLAALALALGLIATLWRKLRTPAPVTRPQPGRVSNSI